jgi:hypothetical protein
MVFSLGPRTRTASILLWPAVTSTFSAAIEARFTLASPATCICASCNIRRARWKVSLRPTAASPYSYFEVYEDIRTAIAWEKQLKGWRREKKLNLIGTINPEFKDLAQTWGWKMITAHEKMYP